MHWHWPDAVHCSFAAHVPHEPVQPSDPHSRAEHCGWHTQRPFVHVSLPPHSLSEQHSAAQ
jgi:hypothetical protein